MLLNILPEDTANELKKHGQTTARRYEHVTILFADFVGFTKLSEKLSPDELVSEIEGTITAINVNQQDAVESQTPLIEIERAE